MDLRGNGSGHTWILLPLDCAHSQLYRNTEFKESENVVAKSEHIFYPSCFAGKDADIFKVIRLITSDKSSDNSWLQS